MSMISSRSLSQGLHSTFLVEEGEAPALLESGLYFFFLLLSFYLLRPLREALGIAKGADKLPWLMTGTLVAMLLVNPAFAALVARFPRKRFIPMVYRFFALNLLIFYGLFHWKAGNAWLGYGFYIWLSVFNLFVVSVFWAFMSDIFNDGQGKRLFSPIASGGTLGAIVGAALTEALMRGFPLGPWRVQATPAMLFLLSAGCLEVASQFMKRLGRRFELDGKEQLQREPGPGVLEGLRLLLRSPYLRLICLYLLLFTLTSTFLYLIQGRIVERTFAGTAARAAAFARIDLWVNVLSLATQFLLAGRIFTRLGMKGALCLVPFLTVLGFGALWIWPTFAVLAAVQVVRRGLHYAVDKPAREMLYIPLGPEEKYKSKPFIDTFIYRGGDAIGVWLPTFTAMLAVPMGFLGVAAGAAWIWTGVRLAVRRAGMGGDRGSEPVGDQDGRLEG
ncbi:MAG: MFS transporter [Holophagaceae bacterium]|nr:MFS transporter [Holophagaceae bacterium]